ncbi:MAG: hypothetical protein JXR68_11190 [Bacteroidales bacterium]|nr:hypothetical protein [Bacteroidales bacterium]
MKKFSVLSLIALLGVMFLSSCGGYTVKTDKKTYAPGETIKVEFTADPNWESNAWIGIIPSNIAHGLESENDMNDISYQYISNKSEGTMDFTAPTEPGKYDIRMHDTDNGDVGVEISSVTFEVK